VWDHASWTNTGLATTELLTQMLTDHENLYLSIKLNKNVETAGKSVWPFDDGGQLKGGSS